MDHPPSVPAPVRPFPLRLAWLGLLVAVALVYHEVPGHRFVNYDDPMYLYENGRVTAGWTAEGLHWAWTNKDSMQWQPVTWMAHMLVSELAGMHPGAHLVTNLVVHALNAVLLLRLLTLLTQAPGRSFAVALLFAVHPVNVETAAWASQLKSTLSTAFALLGLIAYVHHARGGRGGSLALALGGMTLSLLAKPTLVTFPALLILLDGWPLRRLPVAGGTGWRGWLGEKALFFAAAIALGLVQSLAWGSRAELRVVGWPDGARLASVPVNLVHYVGLMFHPADLAVLYPERLGHAPGVVAGALGLLVAVSVAAWRLRHRNPAVLIGWLWFLITLLPASGMIRIGPHGLADRYLYVPGIGLLVAVVWPLADFLRGHPRRVSVILLAVGAGAAAVAAAAQTRSWRDSLTLWRQALAVTPPSAVGCLNLGQGWLEAGRLTEAVEQFELAARLEPANPRAYINLAAIAGRRGELDRAAALLRQALVLEPRDARVLSSLGAVLHDLGNKEEAHARLEEAVGLAPWLYEARLNLGAVLADAGDVRGAGAQLEAALRIRPGDVAAEHNLRLLRGRP